MKIMKYFLSLFICLLTIICKAQSVDTILIQSKIFGQQRRITVLLPAGYNEYPNTYRKYNVAFIFDAQSDDFFNMYKSSIIYLTNQGYVQPLILVGIASDNRQYEFTAKAQTPEGVKNFQKSGGADLLAKHIQEEVLPAIQNKYRCNHYNIGIGHSLGATFVTYCLIKFPEIFNATIAVSPNFQYDREQMVHTFDSAAGKIFDHKFLFIAYGFGDYYEEKFRPASKKIDSLLRTKNISGLRWQVRSLDNDTHGTTPIEGTVKGLLAWNRQLVLWDDVIDSFYKDKSKPFVEHVKNYYKSTSDWAGMQLPTADVINSMGYNCFYTDRKKDAIAVFEWGLSIFPDDINLYDSMGEIQQQSGDKKSALAYYMKGMDVVKKQKTRFDNKTYENLLAGFDGRIKSLDGNR
jgi:predicted alpha/beta superfamily hydrolase